MAAGFVIIFTFGELRGVPSPEQSLPWKLTAALLPSFGIMGATLAVVLAVRFSRRARYALAPLLIASAGGFALLLPRPFGSDAIAYLTGLGPVGLFLAMLACGVAGGWTALMRRVVSEPFAGWAAAIAALATFGMLFALHVSVAAGISAAIWPMSKLGDSYFALMLIVLIEALLWSAGVHGPAVLAPILTPVYLTMQMQNTHAFGAHVPLPYVVVVSLFLLIFPGGAGATFSLAALLTFSRVPRLRKIGRVTLLPAIFNVNDPLLFGVPVVFNPYFVIPFIGTPLVLATVTYAAVASGLVARAAFYIPSFVPAPIGAYAATQDPRAVVLTIANIVLALLIYYPFVRAYERHVGTT